jgi:putative ABC transport system permease protein
MITAYVRSLITRFLHRAQTENDLDTELGAHLQLRADTLERSGLTRAAAERQARLEFGSPERFKEECREAIAGNFIDTLIQDIRFSLRMLRKSPGFTLVVVLTMALGIGATTAIFSVVDSTLLHPLPYPHSEQLVQIVDDLPGIGAKDVGMSVPEWWDLAAAGIFEYVSPVGGGDVNLTGCSQPARIAFLNVPPNYFAMLGIQPALGHAFNPQDKAPGFTLEVVLSDGLWKQSFGGDPAVIGKSLRLDNDLYHVIGVMPPNFHDPLRTTRRRNTGLWAASGFAAAPAPDPVRNVRILTEAIGRLKPGLTIAAAQSRLDAFVGELQKQYPGDYPAESRWTIRLVPLKENLVGNIRSSLMMLFGAVGMVLLIGCVNIANLLLARASARGREMAIRRALGGSRKRLMQQLLTESVLLSVVGAAAGVGILFGAQEFLLQLVPDSLPQLNTISISWSAFGFALLASIGAGVLFGLAPALQAGRPDLAAVLRLESRSSTSSKEQGRTRQALVISEFALSLVLMIVAGLLLRSFWGLLNVSPGFESHNRIAVRTWLPLPNDPKADIYGSPKQEEPLLREMLRRAKTMTGVEEAAIGNVAAVPLAHDRDDLNPFALIVQGHDVPPDRAPVVYGALATPEYFHLMQIPLLRGRSFTDSDNHESAPVVVINETMAKTFWPNADPIGQRLKLAIAGERSVFAWNTIIGVVADVRTESLAEGSSPQFFFSAYQRRPRDLAIFLRGHFDRATIESKLREQVQAIDPELPVFGTRTLDDAVSQSLAQRRFSIEMVGLFALTALVLAAIGIYGVISYIVSERTHEFGIRLALGAERRNILQMVLRQGLCLAIAGAVFGLVGALAVSRFVATLLYGVPATDVLTFSAVGLLFIGVALAACYLPALRATKVDPIIALRDP